MKQIALPACVVALAVSLLCPAGARAQRAAPAAQGDAVYVQLPSATLLRALRQGFPEGDIHMPATFTDDAPEQVRVSVSARGVSRERFLESLLAAAGMEAEEVGGALWVRYAPEGDEEGLELEDLEGFVELVVDGRDVLAESRRRAEERLDPLTRAYLRYRERLKSDKAHADDVRGGNSFLGVRLASRGQRPAADLPAELQEALAKWDGWGSFILEIVPDSPASRSGMLPGDVIVKFAGLWTDSPATLIRLVSRAEEDREYEMEVLREGRVRREWAVVAERPAEERPAPDPEEGPAPRSRRPPAGRQ